MLFLTRGMLCVVKDERLPWDMATYLARVRRACFVCELLDENPDYFHHVVYRDDIAVAFLNKYPAVRGHLLVAPIDHREHVANDFSTPEYLNLQSVIHRSARALTAVVSTERLYVLSLGSQQGNGHVHWHIVPAPPGLPYDDQQLALLDVARGYVDLPDVEQAELAAAIRRAMV
jgi:diadenosine tetraphosphate (Ap4A) HIT family hydrolase